MKAKCIALDITAIKIILARMTGKFEFDIKSSTCHAHIIDIGTKTYFAFKSGRLFIAIKLTDSNKYK